ncbi:MAG: hypothetical protein Q4P18_04110 [Methanobrevibacter sp.]|uniref:dCTP deaminase domain-containing protein n=1 Tax=Methanobrevibacter sp. TaxID=66852 RepID=UPI0026DF4CD6|nr:hypothetical protein [Methanobrevibacter sp.]MDO5848695.1 hypothetical protein [Methanobrevibacter sp.]
MLNSDAILRVKYPQFDEEQYQPAGIDLRAGELFEIDNSGKFPAGVFYEGKHLPKHVPIDAEKMKLPNFDLDGLSEEEILSKMEDSENLREAEVFRLKPNVPYLIRTKDRIKAIHAGQIYLSRSTLMRSGIEVLGAFGDPGFETHLIFLVKNLTNGDYLIEKDARFVQLLDLEVRDLDEKYHGEYDNM